MRVRISFFLLALLVLMPLLPLRAQVTATAAIDLENLISDSELADYNSMLQTDIKNFLSERGSFLKSYFVDTGADHPISATELIYRAAQDHRINPRFLLALLEKEQSLVSSGSPSQRALDFATGYGCFTGENCQDRWKGFHKQINSAAAQFRYYIDNIGEYKYQPGKSFTVCDEDGSNCRSITPQNVSTAALYVYTPHPHGNTLFRKIWNKFFARSLHPDGTLLKAKGETTIYLIQDGKARAFASKAAFASRYGTESLVIEVQKSDIDGFSKGDPIQLVANSLVRDSGGTIYLITATSKRRIASPEVFKTLGFNPEEVDDIPSEQLIDIPDGKEITLNDAYPKGALVQNTQTGGIYFVESGVKYPLWARELLKINYPKLKIFAAGPSELDQYQEGQPVGFKDGVLVKVAATPDVYVISDGNKVRITNEKTFTTLGYKWSNIVTVSDKILALHPDGGELSL